MKIDLKAYGKINLALDVLKKREDGYHEVRMIMQTVDLFDRLTLEDRDEPGISLKTNLSFLPCDENNLCYKAAALLMDEFGVKRGVTIDLEKKIPVAAGMAGGSTDAAAVMVGVNRLFSLGLKKEELMERGVKIGADVPYCVMRGTALSEGIGEILTPLPAMVECPVVIAKPSVSVSTKFVYGNLKVNEITDHPRVDDMIEAIKAGDLRGVAGTMANVLESVTIPEYPVIGQIKEFLLEHGALNSLMSGSGPTVFALFEDEATAQAAADALRDTQMAKNVFVKHIRN
ncbi:MAG: 4-(cytidine 5'-diphospho)-2-C-methyl-D-erythritol kinase [Lachnospiraceae bacterium]|nr:4-(cytidine 5'-diphospho)-2-C-methyl-D-erythritol kinase [Lachnospiraceae bacterium]